MSIVKRRGIHKSQIMFGVKISVRKKGRKKWTRKRNWLNISVFLSIYTFIISIL